MQNKQQIAQITTNEIVCPPESRQRCFALMDCNNFFASCEQVFMPSLAGRPVVVLSSNDGCIIARSKEAKLLDIGMGKPFFECRDVIEKNKVRVFSSNFALYGDMSRRVMSILSSFVPDIEIYSIDEAFCDLADCGYPSSQTSLTEYACTIRDQILQWTGISVSIGIGRTKALSKIANRIAKRSAKADGVLDLMDSPYVDQVLESTHINDVWGIGRRLTKRLTARGINNAKQLRNLNDTFVKTELGVVGLRLVYELRGISCFSLESGPSPAKKGVMSSRSFGRVVESLDELQEAVAAYITNAAAKLRKQKSAAKLLTVYIWGNHFEKRKAHDNYAVIHLPKATNNTAELLHYATRATAKIFKKGARYKKAGVMLDDLVPADQVQTTLFDETDNVRSQKLMDTIDALNAKLGARKLIYATQGATQPWKAKCEKCSPRYTSDWSQIATVSAHA